MSHEVGNDQCPTGLSDSDVAIETSDDSHFVDSVDHEF
jgi:hypothetical protein